MQYIIVTGNPVDGFQYIGPFETQDDAIRYSEKHPNVKDGWWIAPLDSTNDET